MNNMRSASSTGARSGDAHPTALELPDWAQNCQAEYDAENPNESNSGDEHPTADTSLSGPHNKWMRTLMEQVREKIAVAHQKTTPESLTKKRKQAMREKTFCSTLHTMQMAYTKLLHEAFADNYSPEIAATVRNLADSLKWKLHTNCPHRETEGAQLLHQLLNQYQEEFQWKKIAEILESATTHARAEAKKEYEKSKRTKETLRKLRHCGDGHPAANWFQ
jgi:hypothetical protein